MGPTLKACLWLVVVVAAWVFVMQWMDGPGNTLPAVLNGGVTP